MKSIDDKTVSAEMRSHVWGYFQLHASQRLTTFNFYIVISSLIVGALLGALQNAQTRYVGIGLGLLLTFFSFIFWKLDCRTRQLIWHAEEALRHIEGGHGFADVPNAVRIFTNEALRTEEQERARFLRFWKPHFSYSRCFNWVFVAFGTLGIVVAIASATRVK